MVRNLVRLVVLGLVLHAAIKVAPEFWHFVQFRDAVVEAATYGGRKTPDELRRRVASLAQEHGVPVAEDDITVSREGDATYVVTMWTAQLEYLPRRFYPYDFVVNVEGRPQRYGGDLMP